MKDMSKHTPGPWRVEFKNPCYWLVRADGVHLPGGHDVGKVNAQLIAAAPDLLAALHRAATYMSGDLPMDGQCVLAEARAAIAKAEGRRRDE